MFTRDSEGLTDRIWSEVSSTNALVTRVSKLKGIEKSELDGKKKFLKWLKMETRKLIRK